MGSSLGGYCRRLSGLPSTVREVLSAATAATDPRLYCMARTATLEEAAKHMSRHRLSCVVLFDDDNKAVGLLVGCWLAAHCWVSVATVVASLSPSSAARTQCQQPCLNLPPPPIDGSRRTAVLGQVGLAGKRGGWHDPSQQSFVRRAHYV